MRFLSLRGFFFRHICVLLPVILVFGLVSHAQSSLFNIPTTDVLEKGENYVEFDFDTHFSRNRDERWQSYGTMYVRGIGSRFEVGINAYAFRGADGLEPVELQPNVKFNAYENESNGVSVSTGATAYLPLAGRFRSQAAVSVYAVASKSFKSDRAPRLTAGGYQLLGATPDGTGSRGLLLGVEQPLTKRTSFIVDWNTGRNRFGYASAGVGVGLTKRSNLYAAYYFGNEGRGNNFLGVYYGVHF